jgi:adenosylmethionine-8-amino-7-oxononanoate aminotransferase
MGTLTYPDGHTLLRNLQRKYPTVAYGDGIYLFDDTGKRYTDGSSGALVASVGHGNKEVAAAVGEQLARVAYVNGMHFTSFAMEEAARLLAQRAPKGLTRVALLGSGSEAVEAALKFARQWHVERGDTGRTKLIARTPGYHGNTLYALSASGRPHYKKWFGPLLSEVITVSAPYRYRAPFEDYEQAGAEYYANELEATLKRVDPKTVSAFIFEPVVGSSAGAATPPKHYMQRITEICRRYGILLIADEVLCGAGRTGAFFAGAHDGLEPDICVLGKGLSGGYVPTSALLVREEHLAEMKKGSGSFMHAQTYLQAPAMAAATLATLRYMDAHDLVGNAARLGKIFHDELHARVSPLPCVGNIDGIGLLAGVEFVADKKSKTPFPRAKKVIERFIAHCFEDGLIVWPNTGHANGTDGDLIMLGPPLVITETQTRELAAHVARNVEAFFSNAENLQ